MAWYRCGGTPSSVLSLPTPSEASGSIARFNTDLTENLLSAVAEFSASQASGTPTPATPIPIVGVDKVEVVNFTVNIWNEDWETGGYDLETGEKVASTVRIRNKNLIPVKPNMDIYIVVPITIRLFYYGKGKEYIGYSTGNGLKTIPNDTYYIAFQMGSTQNPYQSYNNDISFNYPNTNTTYHAFNGTTALITLGGTYYGGSVDAVTGKITLTHKFGEFSGSEDESWSSYAASTYFGFAISISDMKSGNNQDGKCNFLKVKANYSETGIRLGANNNTVYCLHISDTISGVSDVASWKTYLSNNPLQIVYPLATPIVVYASNTAEIPTIVGENQVYADSGNIAVKFLETVGHMI